MDIDNRVSLLEADPNTLVAEMPARTQVIHFRAGEPRFIENEGFERPQVDNKRDTSLAEGSTVMLLSIAHEPTHGQGKLNI